MQLLLGTFNSNKATELQALLGNGVILYTCAAFKGLEPVAEMGTTLAANAGLKAQHYSNLTGLPCLADDSGLMVDALQGAPGVLSARYAGANATDEQNNHKLLQALAGQANRKATFCTVLAWQPLLGAPLQLFEGSLLGSIALAPKGQYGFGYDALFVPDGTVLTLAELPPEEKNRISHRAAALGKFQAFLMGRL